MFSFEEKFIPDEKDRLLSFLTQYLTFLAKHATPTTLKDHEFISKQINDKTPHSEMLENIANIFTTGEGKPKQLILTRDIENRLGPNRSVEYMGLHADISFMVTQHLRNR